LVRPCFRWGHDGLILSGLPAIFAHAFSGWTAMIVGIALALLLLRRFGRPMPVILCEADICRAVM